jgi:eukaryotic-like serine/threonine-protein kinase
MKKPSKNIWKPILSVLILILGFLIIMDLIVLPLYVSGGETKIPDVVGKNKNEATRILEDANLDPIVQTTRFDEKYGKDNVMYQKPAAGITVKTGRRVYLTVSGGEILVAVPFVVNKTIRDAQITLERSGLRLGKIDSVESELPANTIVEQQYYQGKEVVKGTTIGIKVSVGPQEGMIRVPGLQGKSFTEAENILKALSLTIGSKTYILSSNYLPNTVVDQDPSEGTLLKISDPVNLVLTSSKNGGN